MPAFGPNGSRQRQREMLPPLPGKKAKEPSVAKPATKMAARQKKAS